MKNRLKARRIIELKAELAVLEAPEDTESAPLSWITNTHLVRVPEDILERLNLPDGGSVIFMPRDNGTIELMSAEKFLSYFEED